MKGRKREREKGRGRERKCLPWVSVVAVDGGVEATLNLLDKG